MVEILSSESTYLFFFVVGVRNTCASLLTIRLFLYTLQIAHDVSEIVHENKF